MFAVLNIGVSATATRDWSRFTWSEFKATYARAYSTVADAQAEKTFSENLQKIIMQNKAFAAGESTWWATVNEYSDWSAEEFSAQKMGRRRASTSFDHMASRPPLGSSGSNPASMDWRTKSPSVVTPVKNQAGCGSCWAFASTEVIESHYAIYNEQLLTLAPQTLVDCAPNPDDCGGTGGCEGSIAELAYNYTKASGMALESDLPYTAHDAPCPSYKPAVTLDGYVKNPINSADALETALATVGPVAVNVAAMPWQIYGGGIFSNGCKKGLLSGSCDIDHVVVAYGYAPDYWIVRNSWGSGWGEQGYIRLTRSNDNTTYVDRKPADGTACKPYPRSQTVGGESGILFDTSCALAHPSLPLAFAMPTPPWSAC
jgi:cathepsin L